MLLAHRSAKPDSSSIHLKCYSRPTCCCSIDWNKISKFRFLINQVRQACPLILLHARFGNIEYNARWEMLRHVPNDHDDRTPWRCAE